MQDKRSTVADLLAMKGKRQLSMLRVETLEEAEAAQKAGIDATATIDGSTKYAMYTQDDGAWVKNAAEEEQMVNAMRKSAEATVRGISAKGTETTDVFSLKGLSQALDRVAQDCKR